jgi:RimJ/RimL family protein N-acetyltransferase
MQLVTLGPSHTRAVLDFLGREPIESVYLRGLIQRIGLVIGDRRGRFVGARRSDGALVGMMLLSPLVVPFTPEAEVAGEMGREAVRSRIAIRNIVGRRETVSALWAAMGEQRPPARLIRDRQPVYWVDRDCFRPAGLPADVRRAGFDDLDLVVEQGAAMMLEEVEEDPLVDRPIEYRRFVRERIARGDEFVWTDEEGLCFKCNVSSRTPDLAQIEGVFTPRERRRQGLALRGMSTLCARLLREIPRLSLYVNDFNVGAIRLYERLGFQRAFDCQSIFLSPE